MINPYYIIMTPILIATFFYFFPFKKIKYLMLLVQLSLFVASVINYLYIRNNGPQSIAIGDFESFALISLRYDLIASILIILTTFLFLVMMVFNIQREYVNNLFLFLFIILQCLIIGIFLSNDLFNIYVIYEVSIIVVSILIMYKKETTSIYDGLMFFMINIVSMTLFLFGIGFLYKIFGTLDISMIKQRMPEITDAGTLILPFAFIVTAVSLKTALMPLFSWLPKAHASKGSPTVISAILSGLYVKASIYLFIRITDMFSPKIDMSQFFIIIGVLTGIIGFILAISQKDIKLILAYHTISQIGLIMIGINAGNEIAFYGSVYHILNHAFFKTTLFLSAGIISDAYGTRDINKIKGLYKSMPSVTIATIFAVLGIIGAPFFNGSISKYMIQKGVNDSLINLGIIIINIGTMISFLKYSSMFFGKSSFKKYRINIYRKSSVLVLSVLCFLGGLFGSVFIKNLFDIQFRIDLIDYIDKSLIFFVSLLVSFVFYTFFVKNSKATSKLRRFEFGFNNVCLSIVIFFAVTILFTYLKVT